MYICIYIYVCIYIYIYICRCICRDILLDKVPKKVESLESENADVIRILKNIADDEFLNISRNIKQKVKKLTREIKSRHA